jgi:acetate kinase
MSAENQNILAVNGGSSSIKFSLYAGEPLVKWLSGKIDRIGLGDAKLTYTNDRNKMNGTLPVDAGDLSGAADWLIDWLSKQESAMPLAAVGHRLVHGMEHTQACLIDDGLLEELQRISAYDPDHLPGEIELIRLFRKHDPDLPQVACFDTAFHSTLSPLAKLLPIPRRYGREGVRRYGFHGLSYGYILEELTRIAGPVVAGGAVVMAHLGNGASLAAVKDGESVDTTMGFTPAGGIVMGTRPGDIDPGVIWYIMNKERYDPEQLDHFINKECGLLGVSETSSDMQDLLAAESSDPRAAEAVGLFCYQARKTVGAFSAVLGGLDALVFTGGIGEKSAVIRSRICAGLGYLGIELDQRANAGNEIVISANDARVGVYAIPTDEEWMIAKETFKQIFL